MAYVMEFLGIMAVFSVMIVSPGADTAMVIRQSLLHGRRAARWTSFGIGVSLLFHVGYTALGLGLIISQSLLLFAILKWIGALYLVYLGVQALRAPAADMAVDGNAGEHSSQSAFRSFGLGFLTNALNPKPVLFFLSLFSALVSPETPVWVIFCYGLGMATALTGWFVIVGNLLTVPGFRHQFTRCGRWINRVTGMIFIALGARLAASNS